MVSISSAKLIRERTQDFCGTIINWNLIEINSEIFKKIDHVLKAEYDTIPEKERIGKKIKYISNNVAKGIFQYLNEEKKIDKKFLIQFVEKAFDYGERNNSLIIQHFALIFMAEFIFHYPENFEAMLPLIEKYANYHDWSIRETTADSIVSGLKKIPEKTLNYLSKLAKSDEENLRRLVAESLRPHARVKWLRDVSKNDKILEILTILNKNPSIYVRKSVGNNIKDLSKYMPEKMLDLMESWINKTKIKVNDELATEIGLNEEEKRLIWTVKHGMRWIKERNPEFLSRLNKILGKNYVLYFDEKRNRLAKPLRKK